MTTTPAAQSTKKSRRLAPKLALFGVSVLFALLGSEIVLRVLVGSALKYEYDEEMGYKPLPSQRGFPSLFFLPHATINSLGLRGPEVRPQSTWRVLVVGDSNAFGSGIRDEETFAAQLEAHLEKLAGPSVQVFNGGVPGYGLFQSARLLPSQMEAVDPQVVVFLYALPSALRQPFPHSRSWIGDLAKRLTLYHIAKVGYLSSPFGDSWTLPSERAQKKAGQGTNPFDTIWEKEGRHFDLLLDHTVRKGTRLVVVMHRDLPNVAAVRSKVEGECEKHGLACTVYAPKEIRPEHIVPRDGHYTGLYYREMMEAFGRSGFDRVFLPEPR